MLFSSLEFLCFFLPLFLLCYGIAAFVFNKNNKAKNGVLLVFSLFFYAWGEAVYLLLLLFSIVMNYSFGILINSSLEKEKMGQAKRRMIEGVSLNLLMLGVFKYAGFFCQSLNTIFRLDIPVPEIALPIGISFFTFQIMSYVIDVYKGKVAVQNNMFTLAVYLCAFPQLIAGPIVRYSDVCSELASRRESFEGVYQGSKRFIFGLAKKVIIANTMAKLCDGVIESGLSKVGSFGAIICILAYTLQIYYDFSGYSDMAIGLGKIMGFEYKENFDHPYSAISVTSFWRKWHISLSSFFREYVYIPLGGNRVSKPRWILNLMIVWGLTGLWHGASINFVLWGLYYGVLLVLEKLIWGKTIERIPVVRHIYAIVAFVTGWIFFRMETLSDIGLMFSAIFGKYGWMGTNGRGLVILANNGFNMYFLIVFIVAILLAMDWGFIKDIIHSQLGSRGITVTLVVTDIIALALLAYCFVLLEVGAYNPFIYFRF